MINYELYEYNIINFLKENKALEKFNYNIKKNKTNIFCLYKSNISFKNFLMFSFSWSLTPEGSEYWAELDKKLQNYKFKLNNIIEFNIWND